MNTGLYKLHQIFFAAFAVLAALMVFGGIVAMIGGNEWAGAGLLGVAFLPFAVAHWYAAQGARDGAAYGRVLTRIIGTLWLFGFPIGTALGIFAWSKTVGKQWKSAGAEPVRSLTRVDIELG
jgi:hypothetical protein